MTDRETGKLKGFGFCEFMDLAVAESAKRNLNGREYNGRQLRVDFAGDGDAAAEKKSEKPQGAAATPLHYDTPMGSATASSAQQQMHAAGLGGGGMDAVTARLAEMSPAQLFSVMNQLKTLTQQNQSQARQLLVSNPQLTLALFQAQLALGMTKPPAAMAAAAAAAPPPGGAGVRRCRLRPAAIGRGWVSRVWVCRECPRIRASRGCRSTGRRSTRRRLPGRRWGASRLCRRRRVRPRGGLPWTSNSSCCSR